MHLARLLLGLWALTTTACGPAPVSPLASRLGESTGLNALADFPDIGRQIQQATVAVDEFGTRVRRMPAPGRPKPVTFLTYKALDNNLGMTRAQHLNVLEKAGSNSAINVLAITDEEGPNNTFGYYVRQDGATDRVTSPYMPIWPGERDTGSAYTLAQAVRWGFTSYPGQLRWLDVNNHGYGAFGIAEDERSGHRIELPALAAALEVGAGQGVLDVVSFDACLMATVEVAHELRGSARWMVASEDASYAVGMNYDRTIKALEGKRYDAANLARALVLRAERRGKDRAIYSLSALNLAQAERVTRAVDGLAGALLAALPRHREAILGALEATPRFYLSGDDRSGVPDLHHLDLAAVADGLKARVADPAVQRAATGVRETLFGKAGLVAMTFNAPEQQQGAQGLSIHLVTDGKVSAAYRRTAFARDTRWDEFLLALPTAGRP